MLKLISYATVVVPRNVVDMLDPSYNSTAHEFANVVLATLKANPDLGMIEDYCAYTAGDLLDDEGVIPILAETLSLDDGHHFSDDLQYIYRIVEEQNLAFCMISHYTNGVLNIFYLATE